MQAETGHLTLTGEPDGPPTRYGLSIVDLMTGLAAAFGLLAGVTKARETGIGMDIDTSLFDVALHNLNYPGTWYLNARHGDRDAQRAAVIRAWCRVSCTERRTAGSSSCATRKSSGRSWRVNWAIPNGSTIPSSRCFQRGLKNRDRVTQLLDAALMKQPTEVWIQRLAGKVPVSPVYDIAQALENPYSARARQRAWLQLSERELARA